MSSSLLKKVLDVIEEKGDSEAAKEFKKYLKIFDSEDVQFSEDVQTLSIVMHNRKYSLYLIGDVPYIEINSSNEQENVQDKVWLGGFKQYYLGRETRIKTDKCEINKKKGEDYEETFISQKDESTIGAYIRLKIFKAVDDSNYSIVGIKGFSGTLVRADDIIRAFIEVASEKQKSLLNELPIQDLIATIARENIYAEIETKQHLSGITIDDILCSEGNEMLKSVINRSVEREKFRTDEGVERIKPKTHKGKYRKKSDEHER